MGDLFIRVHDDQRPFIDVISPHPIAYLFIFQCLRVFRAN